MEIERSRVTLLYELTTDRPVFQSSTPHCVIAQILTSEPKRPRRGRRSTTDRSITRIRIPESWSLSVRSEVQSLLWLRLSRAVKSVVEFLPFASSVAAWPLKVFRG
jgi:hypothetical protein